MRELDNGILLPKHFDLERDYIRLTCSHCGKLAPPDVDHFNLALATLSQARTRAGIPFIITSGWRCLNHPVEADKAPGALHAHYTGAFDIGCSGYAAGKVLEAALHVGFLGIGIKMRGARISRFIHMDLDPSREGPIVWSY